jgi:ribosomal protein S20
MGIQEETGMNNQSLSKQPVFILGILFFVLAVVSIVLPVLGIILAATIAVGSVLKIAGVFPKSFGGLISGVAVDKKNKLIALVIADFFMATFILLMSIVAIQMEQDEEAWKANAEEQERIAKAKAEEQERIAKEEAAKIIAELKKKAPQVRSEMKMLMKTVMEEIENGNFESAQTALANASQKTWEYKQQKVMDAKMQVIDSEVSSLQNNLGLAMEPQKVESVLLSISDVEFKDLRKNGNVPKSISTGVEKLDEKIEEHYARRLPQIGKMRKAKKEGEERKHKLKAESYALVNSGIGKKVPYRKWNILGFPETLEGTDGQYWVAYLDKANVSFVSDKSKDTILFAAYGKNAAKKFLEDKGKKRKEQLQAQFSAWDGSHRGLERLIKKLMNDPDSYEHVETVYWDKGDHLVVKTSFRGKNAFGGLVLNWVKAKVDLEGNVMKVIGQGRS